MKIKQVIISQQSISYPAAAAAAAPPPAAASDRSFLGLTVDSVDRWLFLALDRNVVHKGLMMQSNSFNMVHIEAGSVGIVNFPCSRWLMVDKPTAAIGNWNMKNSNTVTDMMIPTRISSRF